MKDLYDSINETILDTNDDALDLDAMYLAMKEWCEKTQMRGTQINKGNLEKHKDGKWYYVWNYTSLNLTHRSPLPLVLGQSFLNDTCFKYQGSLYGNKYQNPLSIQEAAVYMRKLCLENNIWAIKRLDMFASKRDSGILDLATLNFPSAEYDKIYIDCGEKIDIEMPMILDAQNLEILAPNYVRMMGMPSGLRKLEIRRRK